MTRYYVSTALPAQLASVLGSSGNPVVTALPGTWPSSYPYPVLLDWGTASQEAILVSSAPTGTAPAITLPCTRGVDGTTAQAHAAEASVIHGTTSYEPTLLQTAVQDAGDLGGTPAAPVVVTVNGSATSGQYPRGNGTALAMSAIQAGDLPAGTTSAQGALQIDGTSGDIQPASLTAAAGSKGQAADAKHVHPPGSAFLCAPAAYAPASETTLSVNSATLAAFSSANVNTGAFTAPASGSVVVTFSGLFTTSSSAPSWALALSAHGSAGTLYGNAYVITAGSTTFDSPATVPFLVTGLTSGTSYTFDLVGAISTGTLSMRCLGVSSTTPTGASGAPAILTVQAV